MAKDRLSVTTNRVVHSLYLLWTGIRWDVLDLKVSTRIGFVCDRELSANSSTDESKNELVFVCFAVHSYQAFDDYV